MNSQKNKKLSSIVKYIFCFAGFVLLNACVGGANFASALYFAFLYLGSNIILTSFGFLISFAVGFDLYAFLGAVCAVVFLSPIFFFYRKKNKRPKAESIVYGLISQIGFVLLPGETLYLKLVLASLCVILSFIFIKVTRTLFIKGANYKPMTEEMFCVCLFSAMISIGLVNLAGFTVYRVVSLFFLMFFSLLFKDGKNIAVAVTLSLAPSIISGNTSFIVAYSILGLVLFCLKDQHRIIILIAVSICDLIMGFFFKIYSEYDYITALTLLVPAVINIFIPQSVFVRLSALFGTDNAAMLGRGSIRRERAFLSDKLVSLSSSLRVISDCVNRINGDETVMCRTESAVLQAFYQKCAECKNSFRCKSGNFPSHDLMKSVISVGMSKRKLSISDMPVEFLSECCEVSDIILSVNNQLSHLQRTLEDEAVAVKLRELFSAQVKTFSKLMFNLSKDFARSLSFDAECEKKISDYSFKCGVRIDEVAVFGEEVRIVACEKIIDSEIIGIISCCLKNKYALFDKFDLKNGKVMLSLKPAPKLDCCFGMASATKRGSLVSGDKHGIVKISPYKFMMVLSDGMGSGERAELTSSMTVTMLENFFRAGLEVSEIIPTLNSLLSRLIDDNFSAIDVAVCDLKLMSVDFIKLGAPFGFIINSQTVKIIEGNALPVGIVEYARPNIFSSKIKSGDMIMFISDGVSDAFGSSASLLEYLSVISAVDSQKLADSVLRRALSISGGQAADDMTVLTADFKG